MTHTTDRIEDLLQTGVRDEVYPGAVWAVGNAYGTQASGAVDLLDPDRTSATASSTRPSTARRAKQSSTQSGQPSSSATSPSTCRASPWTSSPPTASGASWA